MKRLIASAVALAFSAGIAAAQEGIDNEKRNAYRDAVAGKRVVYIPMNMQADLTIAWHKMMVRQAEELGYSIEVRDPNWSTEAGARALTAAIAEKPDLVVLQNSDVQSYARLIQQAMKAGIKVMQVNMESLVASDTYVGADWVGIGYLAGQEVAQRCTGAGAPSNKVSIVMGVPTSPVDLYQVFGFNKAIADAGADIEIVSQQAANYDPTKARAITASVLQQHPDLCASFGIWDAMDAGAGAAVKEAGLEDQVFVVTSGGGATTSCQKIEEDIFDMLIAFDVRLQGAAINVQIAELLQSPEPAGANPVVYYTPNFKITKENMVADSCWSIETLR